MKLEAKPFLKALEGKKAKKRAGLKTYHGRIAGISVTIACCGVGVDKATAAVRSLIDNYDISQVIVAGTAGGIDSKLKIGDTVVSDDTLFYDQSENPLQCVSPNDSGTCLKADPTMLESTKNAIEKDPPDHPVYFGRIATGKSFITEKNREAIAERYQPLCADMETAAVAQVCHRKGIPFIAVRSISDSVEKSGFTSFLKYAPLASVHSCIVVEKLLRELGKAKP